MAEDENRGIVDAEPTADFYRQVGALALNILERCRNGEQVNIRALVKEEFPAEQREMAHDALETAQLLYDLGPDIVGGEQNGMEAAGVKDGTRTPH